MSSSSIRETLAAALPVNAVGQTNTAGVSFGTIEAWNTVAMVENNSAGGAIDGNAAQVLQSTLQQASDSVTQANKQLYELQALQQQMLASTAQNTQALNANTSAKGSSGGGALSMAGNIMTGILGQGSLLGPVVSGIMSLFGGGHAAPQPTFTVAPMPSPVQFETTIERSAAVPAPVSAAASDTSKQPVAGPTQPIQIQVNAMDARSFLDHSNEIANAVRQALLNSHSLSDVIAEL